MTTTLYQRLGGEAGITRLVTDVVANHYRNPLIRSRFEASRTARHWNATSASFSAPAAAARRPTAAATWCRPTRA